MDILKKINSRFLDLLGKKYRFIDVKMFTFWTSSDPIVNSVAIYFIVNTEKEKLVFEKYSLEKCSKEYLYFIREVDELKKMKFKFYVLSKEEVKKKYGGNYYYAMH